MSDKNFVDKNKPQDMENSTPTVNITKLNRKNKKGRKMQKTWDDILFDCIVYFGLSFAAIIILYPLIYVLSASFSTPYAVTSGKVWLYPVDFSLIGYETVFKTNKVLIGYKNSLIVACSAAVVSVLLTMCYAYVLSIRDFVGRKFFTIVLIITMFFGGGLIPSFLLIQQLGLYDTYWALILPGAVSAYNIVIARTFISSSIPYDLYEAASIDGCSDFNYFIRMIIPLSKPIIAVLTLYAVVGQWNNYFSAMIYLSTPAKYTLQLILRDIIIQNRVDPTMMIDVDLMQKRQGLSELLKYSLIVVSSVPMLMLYPFIQKHFVKGVMVGSVKG